MIVNFNTLKELTQEKGLQVIFQTGKKKFDLIEQRLSEIYSEYKSDKNLIVRPYFDDMVSPQNERSVSDSDRGQQIEVDFPSNSISETQSKN